MFQLSHAPQVVDANPIQMLGSFLASGKECLDIATDARACGGVCASGVEMILLDDGLSVAVEGLVERFGITHDLAVMLIDRLGLSLAIERLEQAAARARARLESLTGQRWTGTNLQTLTTTADGIVGALINVDPYSEPVVSRRGHTTIASVTMTAEDRLKLSDDAERTLLAREYGSLAR